MRQNTERQRPFACRSYSGPPRLTPRTAETCREVPNTFCFPRTIECFVSAWVYLYPESIKLSNHFDILTRDKRPGKGSDIFCTLRDQTPSVVVRLCPNVYHSSKSKSDSVQSMIYIEPASRPKPALETSLPRGKTCRTLVSYSIEFKVIYDSQMIYYGE